MDTLGSYVISMDTPSGKGRLANVRKQFEDAGVQQPTLFAGVNGRAMSAEQVKAVATPKCQARCPPSVVGCALSHIGVWKSIIDQNMDACLIVEDDVELETGFAEKFKRAMRDVPKDYDLLFMGCRDCDLSHQTKSHPVFGSVRQVDRFTALHCYVVSRKGAEFLVAAFQRLGGVDDHIDQTMQKLKGMNVYATIEELAYQDRNAYKTSTNAFLSSFPTCINEYFSTVYDKKWKPLSYDFNVTSRRIGPYEGPHMLWTNWHGWFFAIGLAGFPFSWMTALAALDAGMYQGKEHVAYVFDMMSKIFVYGIGLAISTLVRKKILGV